MVGQCTAEPLLTLVASFFLSEEVAEVGADAEDSTFLPVEPRLGTGAGLDLPDAVDETLVATSEHFTPHAASFDCLRSLCKPEKGDETFLRAVVRA